MVYLFTSGWGLTLKIEKVSLRIQAAREAGELAVETDDAMTRNNDGDWISAVSGADGARGVRVS